ncbi:hypothetical protein RZO08_002227, partial [Shigella flexneri]|nr:hypothetical protein [Shigella flexneri]
SSNSRGADFFSKKHVFKVAVSDLDDLVKNNQITVLTQEKVKAIFGLESSKKIRKELGNILQNMARNNEVLVHGQILGNKVSRCN